MSDAAAAAAAACGGGAAGECVQAVGFGPADTLMLDPQSWWPNKALPVHGKAACMRGAAPSPACVCVFVFVCVRKPQLHPPGPGFKLRQFTCTHTRGRL
eukprot:1156355-Pelagomonas_calceolata.AAC.2